MNKKININDPSAWHDLDWNEPVVPEILKKSDRVVETGRQNRLKAQDPGFIEKLKLGQQRVLADPSKVKLREAAAKKAGKTKKDSVKYHQLVTEINRKKAESPEFAKNVSRGIKAKHQDPAYKEKMQLKAQSQCYKIKDPTGKIWDNANEAGQHWFPNPNRPVGPSRKVRNLVNMPNSGWSRLNEQD